MVKITFQIHEANGEQNFIRLVFIRMLQARFLIGWHAPIGDENGTSLKTLQAKMMLDQFVQLLKLTSLNHIHQISQKIAETFLMSTKVSQT